MAKTPKTSKLKTYNKFKVNKILDLVAHGTPAVKACEQVGVSYRSFARWVANDIESLKERYEEAKRSHYELLELELKSIHEAPYSKEELSCPALACTNRNGRANSIKWILEKRARHIYGNHVTVENNYTVDISELLDKMMPDRSLFVHSAHMIDITPPEDPDKSS